LAGLPPIKKADVLSIVMKQHGKDFFKAFTVVSPGMLRVRGKQNT
jgi:hypothetical protein